MKEHNSQPTPSWKGCIIFGIVNIGLVLLCTKLQVMILSASLVLMILCGVAVTAQFIKEDWKAGFKMSAIGCSIGFIFQCCACVLYIVNILSSLVAMIKAI